MLMVSLPPPNGVLRDNHRKYLLTETCYDNSGDTYKTVEITAFNGYFNDSHLKIN